MYSILWISPHSGQSALRLPLSRSLCHRSKDSESELASGFRVQMLAPVSAVQVLSLPKSDLELGWMDCPLESVQMLAPDHRWMEMALW